MDTAQHNRIADFIWGIAADVLRDIYVRGKYRDVILPMTVVRRLDSVLEPTKDDVLAMKVRLDSAGITNQDAALRGVAKQAFYNTLPFTLKSLLGQPKQLKANFEAYLDGFSPNIQEILEKFEFRNQIPPYPRTPARCGKRTHRGPTRQDAAYSCSGFRHPSHGFRIVLRQRKDGDQYL